MTAVEVPVNEKQRIEVLNKYGILDTPSDGSFDRITQLASTIFNVPIAIISLVDTDRIWFKSHHGLLISQIGRDPGLCASAIFFDDPYIVENAMEDPRTLANPLVAGEFGLRFYASAPLQTEDNFNLGTLCIIDKTPDLHRSGKLILQQLAAIVMDEMNMRLSLRNTANRLKSLSSDISAHLKDTITHIETFPEEKQNAKLISYLDASRVFLGNMENELDNL